MELAHTPLRRQVLRRGGYPGKLKALGFGCLLSGQMA